MQRDNSVIYARLYVYMMCVCWKSSQRLCHSHTLKNHPTGSWCFPISFDTPLPHSYLTWLDPVLCKQGVTEIQLWQPAPPEEIKFEIWQRSFQNHPTSRSLPKELGALQDLRPQVPPPLSLSHPLWCQINNTFLNHEIMWWHHYNVQHTPMAKFVLTNLKASKKRVTDHIEFVQRFVAWELPPARSWDNLSCDSRGSSSALMNSVHWIWMLRSGREPWGAKKPCKPIQWTFMSCHQTVGIISIMYHSARRCAKIWFVASLPRSCWSAKNLCCSCSLFACW